MMKPHPYIDMDGVLVDFLKGATQFWKFDTLKYNARFNDIWPQLSERARLQEEWPTFWRDLEPLPHSLQLWTLVHPYHASILTAVPETGWTSCSADKLVWCARNLPKFDEFGLFSAKQQFHGVFRHEKMQFAKQADGTPNLLVDDFKQNIAEWEAAGGIGLHYKDGAAGLALVKKTLQEIYK